VKPVQIKHLDRYYGDIPAVKQVTFDIEEGEIFGFLGPNGAGKTTTIRVLMGLLKPTNGSVTVFGLDSWRDSSEVNAKVGYLPGDIHLYEKMTSREFLDYFGAFRSGNKEQRRNELAKRVDLDLNRKIGELSKGNRQKVAIVQALMHDAPLLILDEPTAGLDPLRQADFLELLKEEQARGTTVFLSSHLLNAVEKVANRVGIIRDGKLVAVEDIRQLKLNRQREMELFLREPCSLDPLTELAGIRVLHVEPDGLQVKLSVRGEFGPLLRVLAELPVEDMVYGPPDLESVFIHYYDGNEESASVSTPEEVAV
jgi:ABC-2 type transport system ATP-binding protein